jgi:hypothetical protein
VAVMVVRAPSLTIAKSYVMLSGLQDAKRKNMN